MRRNLIGDTPLHEAASQGHRKIAELLIENGALVDATNDNGWTPLLQATNTDANGQGLRGDNSEVVTLLLDYGANVNARGPKDITPLHWAVAMNHKEVVKILLDRGADVTAQEGISDQTPRDFGLNFMTRPLQTRYRIC